MATAAHIASPVRGRAALRILVVGGAAVGRRVALAADRLGAGCDAAASAAEALHRTARAGYALVIVDLTGDPDAGVDALRALRDAGVTTRALVVTDKLQTSLFARLMPLDLAGFVLAAAPDDELVGKLAGALGVSVPAGGSARPGARDAAGGPDDETGEFAAAAIGARVLVVNVAPPAGPELVRALHEIGLEPHEPADGDPHPFALLERDERFAAVAVSLNGLPEEAFARLRQIAFDNPQLKCVAMCAPAGDDRADQLAALGVQPILPLGTDPAEVAAAVARRVGEHDYDPAVAAAIQDGLPSIMAGIRLEPMQPLLRVSSRMLGEMTAIVELGGEDLDGCVLVSGNPLLFTRLARDWLGEKPRTKDLVWDAAGELINRIAGVVRTHYAARGLRSDQSTPTIVEGDAVRLRHRTRKPSLVVPFAVESFSTPVYVELVLRAKSADRPDEAPEIVEAGEIEFF